MERERLFLYDFMAVGAERAPQIAMRVKLEVELQGKTEFAQRLRDMIPLPVPTPPGNILRRSYAARQLIKQRPI